MMLDDLLTTLDVLWAAWKRQGEALTDAQWDRPTRLGTWDVQSLYAHAAAWPLGFSKFLGRVHDVEPTHPTAAALLRDFNRPDGIAKRRADQVAAGAREDAATYSAAQMIEQFVSTGPEAIAKARQLGPVVVDYFGLAMLRLDEAASIGIMEATVHLLDLRRALDRPPDAPPDGLAHTAAVLAETAPPVDFIEVATGRSTLELFPVLT
jgi:uncharacterized protein (TIGR03083 family)